MTETPAHPSIDYSDVTCVMPGCGEALYLTWTGSRSLVAHDLTEAAAIDHSDAETSTWEVECVDGHVVLTPAELDFSDDDGTAHNYCDPIDHDHNEESRTFTASDAARLAALVVKMRTVA